MTRRRRPGVPEEAGDRARAHLPAFEIQRHQNVPPGRMRKRLEDRFVRVGKGFWRLLRQCACSYRFDFYLAYVLNVGKHLVHGAAVGIQTSQRVHHIKAAR
jgi:hypothetical protein